MWSSGSGLARAVEIREPPAGGDTLRATWSARSWTAAKSFGASVPGAWARSISSASATVRPGRSRSYAPISKPPATRPGGFAARRSRLASCATLASCRSSMPARFRPASCTSRWSTSLVRTYKRWSPATGRSRSAPRLRCSYSSPAHSPMRTRRASCIATSNRRTCCSPATTPRTRRSSTSGSRS